MDGLITDDILEPGDIDMLVSEVGKRSSGDAGFAEAPVYNSEVDFPVFGPENRPSSYRDQQVIDLTDDVPEAVYPPDTGGLPDLPRYEDNSRAIVTVQRAPWTRDISSEYRRMQYQAQNLGDIRQWSRNKRKADIVEARQAKLNQIRQRRASDDALARSLRIEADTMDSIVAGIDIDGIGPQQIDNSVVDRLPAVLEAGADEASALLERYGEEALRAGVDYMFEGFQAPRQRRIGSSRQPVFQLDDVNVDQMVAGGEGLVDRLIRRVNNGRNWGGSSGRAYIGNSPNPLGTGTVNIYQGAAVDSSVNIPGINMERPTPQPAQPASYGVEEGGIRSGAFEDDPDLVLDTTSSETFFGRPIRVASDALKDAVRARFMGTDFLQKPGFIDL